MVFREFKMSSHLMPQFGVSFLNWDDFKNSSREEGVF
jgi:hypothetical protein